MKTVTVEIKSGYAYVLNKPKGIQLILRDYDCRDDDGKAREEVYEAAISIPSGTR